MEEIIETLIFGKRKDKNNNFDLLLQYANEFGLIELLKEKSLPYQELMTYYKCAMMEIATKFNVLNEEFSLQYDRNPIESIKTRLKSPVSIFNKLTQNNLSLTIDSIEENIKDVAGIRVICSTPEDIYQIVECLRMQDDIRILIEKDYIKNPKPNGYRSLHLIVEIPIFLAHKKKIMKAEIQLRSIAMDFWASIEHKLIYKKDTSDTDDLIAELKECAEISAQLDLRMEQISRKIDQQKNKATEK